jgi:hypothetical protein
MGLSFTEQLVGSEQKGSAMRMCKDYCSQGLLFQEEKATE